MKKDESASTNKQPDQKNQVTEEQSQSQPQLLQFEIPVQQPVQSQPNVIQLQGPPQEGGAPQQILIQNPQQQQVSVEQPLPNVVNLIKVIDDSTLEGNRSESQVSSQIILIASAVIAILGVFALNSEDGSPRQFSWQIGSLLVIAVIALGMALASGIMHFVLERRFWYENRQRGMDAVGIISAIGNPTDRNNAAAAASNQLKPGSNRTAFYLQVLSFFIGVIALLILVVSEVISKVN